MNNDSSGYRFPPKPPAIFDDKDIRAVQKLLQSAITANMAGIGQRVVIPAIRDGVLESLAEIAEDLKRRPGQPAATGTNSSPGGSQGDPPTNQGGEC